MFLFLALVVAFLVIISIYSGAPYVPAHKVNQSAVFDLLDLKKGQVFVDLGSGDGKMLREAARRGYKAVGYEINPLIWLISWILCRPYGDKISVKLASLWNVSLENADGVAVFLMGNFMERLEKKLKAEGRKNKFKVASIVFELPTKKPTKVKNGVFLYKF